MASITIAISGMRCDHCVATVRDALEAVTGVWSAQVELEAGRAEVGYDDPQASADALIHAVEHVGYRANVAP